jgi:predicted RNA-binding protein
MAITTIDSVKTTDTFEKQRTSLNEVVGKLNKIDLDETELHLSAHGVPTEPADSEVANNSFCLYMTPAGKVRIKVNIGGAIETHELFAHSG